MMARMARSGERSIETKGTEFADELAPFIMKTNEMIAGEKQAVDFSSHVPVRILTRPPERRRRCRSAGL